MALIKCPECQNSISDKAAKCPHCGLPAEYFDAQSADSNKNNDIDYKSIANIIISFDKDYIDLFSDSHYISHREQDYRWPSPQPQALSLLDERHEEAALYITFSYAKPIEKGQPWSSLNLI